VGSSIASELGTMRITQQIDVLDMMGVNSANYLILPKIMAMVTIIPLLVTFSIAAGFVGAYAMCFIGHLMNADDMTYGLRHSFETWHMWSGFLKSFVFAFIIASVSGYFGYSVKGGSVEVGKASTNAVVYSSIIILFSDLILSKILMG
jgi:phospholipid/cholesterol/gamma-HCH transport system permease protein